MYCENTCPCVLISGRLFLALPILQTGCRQGPAFSWPPR